MTSYMENTDVYAYDNITTTNFTAESLDYTLQDVFHDIEIRRTGISSDASNMNGAVISIMVGLSILFVCFIIFLIFSFKYLSLNKKITYSRVVWV